MVNIEAVGLNFVVWEKVAAFTEGMVATTMFPWEVCDGGVYRCGVGVADLLASFSL